jgi:type IV secretory pathway VirB6-like protein
LHIFLASAAGIIILVFVSPIVIPTALFAKTSDIFKKWVTELIGYCLQPMILFAYIAFFITIMDRSMIGSATFHGQAPSKTISCNKTCLNSNGTIEPYVNDEFPDCADEGDKIVNPMDDSVACLINLDDYGTIQALSMIGVAIPILMNVFGENGKVKVLTIVKGALVMYLLYKFMNEISGIAARLVGGSSLPSSSADPVKMMKQVQGVLAKIQKRAGGATKKMGKKGLEKAGAARESIGKGGNQGRKEGESGGADSAADAPAKSEDADDPASGEGGDDSDSGEGGDDSDGSKQ